MLTCQVAISLVDQTIMLLENQRSLYTIIMGFQPWEERQSFTAPSSSTSTPLLHTERITCFLVAMNMLPITPRCKNSSILRSPTFKMLPLQLLMIQIQGGPTREIAVVSHVLLLGTSYLHSKIQLGKKLSMKMLKETGKLLLITQDFLLMSIAAT